MDPKLPNWFGNWVLEPFRNRPVSYCLASSKKSQFCRTVISISFFLTVNDHFHLTLVYTLHLFENGDLLSCLIESITNLPPSRKLQTLSSRFDTSWKVSLMICCCCPSSWKVRMLYNKWSLSENKRRLAWTIIDNLHWCRLEKAKTVIFWVRLLPSFQSIWMYKNCYQTSEKTIVVKYNL